MNTQDMSDTPQTITGWHAHVYYGEQTVEQATALCEAAAKALPVEQGRVHRKLVGPHPQWSCQLAFEPAHLADVVTWLTLNRNGLTVFVHPNTGDDLVDHRDRAVWLGDSDTLKLDIFKPRA